MNDDLLFDETPTELPVWDRLTERDVVDMPAPIWRAVKSQLLDQRKRVGAMSPDGRQLTALLQAGDEVRRVVVRKKKYGKRWKTGGRDHSLQALEDAGRAVIDSKAAKIVGTAAVVGLGVIAPPAGAGVAAGLAAARTASHLARGGDFGWEQVGDLAQAASSVVPGGAVVTEYLGHARRAVDTVQAARHGDYLGAVSSGAGLARAAGVPSIQLPKGLSQLSKGLPRIPQLPKGLPQLPKGLPRIPQLPKGLPQLPKGLSRLPQLSRIPQLPKGLPRPPKVMGTGLRKYGAPQFVRAFQGLSAPKHSRSASNVRGVGFRLPAASRALPTPAVSMARVVPSRMVGMARPSTPTASVLRALPRLF